MAYYERYVIYLTYKRRYVCLSVYLSVGLYAGDGKLGMGTHVDPGSVLVKVKVKVIFLCVRYNRNHACATWCIFNHEPPAKQH